MLVVALGLFWLGVALSSLHAALPTNPVTSLFAEDRLAVRSVLPQGWAFFTRSPREERTLPFLRDEGGVWHEIHTATHAEPRHAFGLNRRSRAQGVEVGLLLGEVSAAQWHDCGGPVAGCLDEAEVVARLRNPSPAPSVCGDVALVRREPLPWAWSQDDTVENMPALVARLEVSC